MSRLVVYPYKVTSKSAKRLVASLKEKKINAVLADNSDFEPTKGDIIIGWGSGNWPEWKSRARNQEVTWLNPSNVICDSVDKVQSFKLFRAAKVACPPTTDQYALAKRWLNEGHSVLARMDIEGHDGSGITVMNSPKDFMEAPLYSKYVEKTWEYRVHVLNGEAFWSQERHPLEEEDNKFFKKNPDEKIRTTNKGWTLYVANAKIPEICKREAERAIEAIGLDFGAVDIGWKASARGEPESVCIYEVNTAPELSERTCEAYANKFKSLLG